MKRHIRLAAVFLTFLTVFGMLPFSAAAAGAERDAQASAEALNRLGLVQGYETADGRVNFALEDSLTRAQAIALVVRFLGAEAEAAGGNYTHPFEDVPAWAEPYVGYAYANKITQGVGNSRFGTDEVIGEAAFLTSILRVLGYEDKNDGSGDFIWSDPFALAKTAGLTENSAAGAAFRRGDAFCICYRALTAAPKAGDSVAARLISKGIFTQALFESVMDQEDIESIREETVITPIALLNTKGTDGAHAEDNFLTASLEIDYRASVTLSSTTTGYSRYDQVWYPRVKKVKDDLYLLLYHHGNYGTHLYYATSSDGIHWNAPQVFYNSGLSEFTYTDGPLAGTTDRYFAANPDACVLDNGDILVVYSLRPNKGYNKQEYIDLNIVRKLMKFMSLSNRR